MLVLIIVAAHSQSCAAMGMYRVVHNAVQNTPAASEADVAQTLRGVLRTISMDDEGFESAVSSLLRTLSSTSSQSSGAPASKSPITPQISSALPYLSDNEAPHARRDWGGSICASCLAACQALLLSPSPDCRDNLDSTNINCSIGLLGNDPLVEMNVDIRAYSAVK